MIANRSQAIASLAAILLALLVVSSSASAGFMPNFTIDVARKAAEIVIVKPSGKPDQFIILETWRGKLAKDEAITVRHIPFEEFAVHQWIANADVVTRLHGDRLLLFLTKLPADQVMKGDIAGEWVGAFGWGSNNGPLNPMMSLVVIENGLPFTFRQESNPGPEVLSPAFRNEADFKRQVEATLAEWKKFDDASAVKDPAGRIRALAPLAISSSWGVCGSVQREMRKAGAAAAAILHNLLDDHDCPQLAVARCVEASGDPAEISRLLERETTYWEARAPGLSAAFRAELEPAEVKNIEDHLEILETLLPLIPDKPGTPAGLALERLYNLALANEGFGKQNARGDAMTVFLKQSVDAMRKAGSNVP